MPLAATKFAFLVIRRPIEAYRSVSSETTQILIKVLRGRPEQESNLFQMLPKPEINSFRDKHSKESGFKFPTIGNQKIR